MGWDPVWFEVPTTRAWGQKRGGIRALARGSGAVTAWWPRPRPSELAVAGNVTLRFAGTMWHLILCDRLSIRWIWALFGW
jgi:hypothetical protein